MAFRMLPAAIGSIAGLIALLPLFLLTLPLWALSCLTRWLLGWQLRRTAPVPWREILQYDPEIGWKPKPNLEVHYLDQIGDLCSTKTCAAGWPGTVAVDDADVYVLGDSYAFGYGVDYDECYLARTGALKVKALAAPGYNMVQAVLLLQKYRELMAGKLVVWFVCIENDLTENVTPAHPTQYRIPFVRRTRMQRGWAIVTEHLSSERWPFRVIPDRLSRLMPFLFAQCELSDELYDAAEYLLARANDICRAAGAQLVVVTIPVKAQVSAAHAESLGRRLPEDLAVIPQRPDRKLAAACSRLGISFRSGADVISLSDFKTRDSHWRRSGHAKMARLLTALATEVGARAVLRPSDVVIASAPQHEHV
jgi:hypothetical protein